MKLQFLAMTTLVLYVSNALALVEVAITIDDLPKHSLAPSNLSRVDIMKKMLETLKKYSVPEVYGFINAEKIENEPDLIEVLNLWIKAGYPLGNHTYSHKSLNEVSIQDFEYEIDANEPLLERLNATVNWKFFHKYHKILTLVNKC